MEYDKAIKALGEFGKYQKLVVFLLALPIAFNGETTLMFNFILGNQLHRCKVSGIGNGDFSQNSFMALNSTIQYNVTKCTIGYNGTETECTEWVYDHTEYETTLVSKFNMVCKDGFTRSHILMAFFLGQMAGSALYGPIIDLFGRKAALISSTFIMFISNLITPWMPNVYLVAACQFFNAVGSMGNYVASMILVSEMVGPSYRVLISFIIYFAFCVGEFLVLIKAYLLRDVRATMLAISIPIGLAMFIFVFIPESPRWLITRKRFLEAKTVLAKMAKYNGCKFDINTEKLIVSEDQTYSFRQSMIKIIHSKVMIKRLTIVTLNWLAINLIYYGIGINVGDLGGNVYVNFAIAAVSETVAILICYWSNLFSRRKLFSAAMIVGSLSCLSTFFTSYFAGQSLHWMTICLAMVGKLGVSIAFFLVYIITGEIFPTVMRATVFGFCNTGGKIGALISPYVGKLGVLLDTRFGTALPLIVFGLVGTIVGIFDLFLPESRKVTLPDTLEQAENISGKDRHLDHSKEKDAGPLTYETTRLQ